MNEAETRAELIDPALKEAGWGVVDGSRFYGLAMILAALVCYVQDEKGVILCL